MYRSEQRPAPVGGALVTALVGSLLALLPLGCQRAPTSPEQRASYFLDQGKYQEAIDLCDQMLASNAGDSDARMIRGQAYLNLNQCEDAAADFTTVIQARPDDPEALYHRAEVYLQMKRNSEDEQRREQYDQLAREDRAAARELDKDAVSAAYTNELHSSSVPPLNVANSDEQENRDQHNLRGTGEAELSPDSSGDLLALPAMEGGIPELPPHPSDLPFDADQASLPSSRPIVDLAPPKNSQPGSESTIVENSTDPRPNILPPSGAAYGHDILMENYGKRTGMPPVLTHDLANDPLGKNNEDVANPQAQDKAAPGEDPEPDEQVVATPVPSPLSTSLPLGPDGNFMIPGGAGYARVAPNYSGSTLMPTPMQPGVGYRSGVAPIVGSTDVTRFGGVPSPYQRAPTSPFGGPGSTGQVNPAGTIGQTTVPLGPDGQPLGPTSMVLAPTAYGNSYNSTDPKGGLRPGENAFAAPRYDDGQEQPNFLPNSIDLPGSDLFLDASGN
ncbi:MAG: tetratricopeptide repeat protein [Pirellulaceae bacterium]